MGHLIFTAVLSGTAAFLTGFCAGILRRYRKIPPKFTPKVTYRRNDTELERHNREYRDFLYYDGTATNETEREK